MLVLGLTGSIGMGKTATAAAFAAEGVPVHDADRAVHRLYAGEAVAEIEAAFPGTTRDGAVDRARLGARVLNDPNALARLEALVHPRVRAVEGRFIDDARAAGAPCALLDVPLLLETGMEKRVDAVVVVSAAAAIQRARVLARPGMSEDKFAAIAAKQMPDADKRRRAHFIVDTGRGFDSARAQVRGILRAVATMPGRSWPRSDRQD